MEKRFAWYIFLGLVIGALLGASWQGGGQPVLGASYGALAGAGIGWFIAAALTQAQNQKDKAGK